MTHDFQSDPHAPRDAHAPLSAAAEARKRELLPMLQRQLGWRRARRKAVRGGVVVAAAAVVIGAGAMLSLRAQPGASFSPGPEQVASTGGDQARPTGSGQGDRAVERATPDGSAGVDGADGQRLAQEPPDGSTGATARHAQSAASFTLVCNDPTLVARSRIDDRRLVQELRSAGYEAGLVRTRDRVFLMMNDER